MPLTVEIPDDVLRRLRVAAAARGITVEQLAAQTLAQIPDEAESISSSKLAFLAAGASETGISHQIDELLADGFGRD